MTSIIWFRNDLRLEDNNALQYAIKNSKQIIPLFICSTLESRWSLGSATKWWLHHSLVDLQKRLSELGLPLIICQGDPEKELQKLIKKTQANLIVWNRCYEPEAISRDTLIKQSLTNQGITVKSFPGNLLMEPWEAVSKEGKPYQVFTPFWKNFLKIYNHTSIQSIPDKCSPFHFNLDSLSVDDLQLLPQISWDREFYNTWTPGSGHVLKKVDYFIHHSMSGYRENRDFPFLKGVSELSPHLHFGEISPRMIWERALASSSLINKGTETFLKQLGWREFAHHLLYHFPKTPDLPLRSQFDNFPWKENRKAFDQWKMGLTGYPIIDAGMRQLWRTGWMHNRVRMIVGSFLVKDLLISWIDGAKWFWDTLVDADLANNTLGWQWVGGCGADAAPYFRVFNPVLQSEKFDSEGEYIKKWLPELKYLPKKWIHTPWLASEHELASYGIHLGKNYPWPIVDHDKSRIEALAAFKSISES